MDNEGIGIIKDKCVEIDGVVHLIGIEEQHITLCNIEYKEEHVGHPKDLFFTNDNELCGKCVDKIRRLLSNGLARAIANISPLDI